MTKDEALECLRASKDELQKKFGIVSLGLFGSFSRGDQNSKSDIDIAVEIASEKKSLANFFGIKRELENRLGRKVDLGIESTLKPIVKTQVKQEIIYV